MVRRAPRTLQAIKPARPTGCAASRMSRLDAAFSRGAEECLPNSGYSALGQAPLACTPQIYPGLPHGLLTTNADVISQDLLAFIPG